MSEYYVLSAETDSPQLATEVATALREWVASRNTSISLTQKQANEDAQDVEGSLLLLLAVHVTAHVLGDTACSLIHSGIETIQTKYGVRLMAKAPDGKEGPAQEILPKPE